MLRAHGPGHPHKFPRLEETIQSADKCNYRKIGMAFCVGLEQEARMLTDIFSAKGFEMVSVNCTVGAIPTLKEWSFRQTRGDSEYRYGPGRDQLTSQP